MFHRINHGRTNKSLVNYFLYEPVVFFFYIFIVIVHLLTHAQETPVQNEVSDRVQKVWKKNDETKTHSENTSRTSWCTSGRFQGLSVNQPRNQMVLLAYATPNEYK